MADSSFFKNTGTSTQFQTTASASAAAALASEQAALVSKNAAAVSETNAASSAASALVHSNAAASSVSSINANAISTAADVITTAGHAATTTADATQTNLDRIATNADVVLTNADVVSTNSDAVQTAADRVQTGLDVTASSASAAAALASENASATSETNAAASATSSSADATATAADRVQTGLDRAATNADAIATAADRVQTGLDVTASANSASAANTSASAASSDAAAAAASAAAAANSYDQFDDRYLGSLTGYATAQTGPALDNDGNALVSGTLFFSADANEMRVYDGTGWIAASSAGSSSLINYHYTATASQTTFSGSDENSNTLSYTVDNLIVTKNGIVLEDGTDYTATSGTSIVLASAAAVNDEINIVAFKSFTTADMVSATNGGTFQGNVDFAAGADVTGNITVTGTVDGRDVAADGTKLDGIEASADVTDATNVTAAGAAMLTGATFTGAVTATAFSGDGSALTGIPTPTLTSLGIANHDDITVDASGNVGIGTSVADAGASLTVNKSPVAAHGNPLIQVGGSTYTSGGYYTVGLGYTNSTYTEPPAEIAYVSKADSGGTKGDIVFGTRDVTTNTAVSTRMTISSAGNVGIGTALPTKKVSTSIGLNDTDGYVLEYSGDAKGGILLNPISGEVRMGALNSSGTYFTTLYSNNTERLRIDSSGRVTMPYQPAFFASLNGNWGSWTPNNQTQIVPFDLTSYNIGNHFNVNTGLFTCPVAGNYMFSYGTYVGGQSIEQVWLVKAGARNITVGFANAGATGDRSAATQVIRCAANDTVGVCPYGSSATTGTVFSNFYHTFFVGAFIG